MEKGGAPCAFARRKTEALLAYLALHPGPQPREKIVGDLWGDASDEDARRTLRVILTDARKVLGEDAFIGDRATLGLNPAAIAETDAHQFEAICRQPTQAPPAQLEAALRLYRGELLAGLYHDWLLPRRERFHLLWLTAVLTLIAHYRTAGDYPRAIQHARALLQQEPAEEQAHQHLIFCLAANGEREAALRQVEACRAALQKQLGVDLSPETKALAASIQKRATETTAARLGNLSRPPTSFIGREDELNDIETRLTETRLLTLIGPGGSGKTRLAIQAADELSFDYPGGVWWVDLTPLIAPELVAQSIANTMGVKEQGNKDLLEATARLIGEQRMLIVLDNCEHLLVACAQVVDFLLAHCPALVFLTTSREPLDLPGEIVWQTPALPLPAPESSLKALQKNEAVSLFAARARAANGHFQLGEQNIQEVADICRHLEGIPLAIELAAAQANNLDVSEIKQRLAQTLDLQLAAPHGRYATLRAAIEWSYNLLSPLQQILFRRLAVFDGGWELDAASVVAAGYAEPQTPLVAAAGPHGLTPLPISSEMVTQQALEHLARKGLVQPRRSQNGPRYTLLEALAEFAREKCQQADEWERLAAAHASYFFNLLERQWPNAYSEGETAVLDQIERETANLRRAWRWQTETAAWYAPPQAIKYQSRFWTVRGHYTESRLLLPALLTHPALADLHPARAELLNSLGLTEWQSGATGAAKVCFARALADYEALGLRQSAAMASVNLGGVYVDEEDAPHAEHCLEQGLAWARESGHERALMIGLNNLGNLMTDLGNFGRARLLLEDCLALRRNLGDLRGVGITLNNLADVEAHEARFEVARPLYLESLEIRARLGDRRGVLIPALNLARLLGQEGHWSVAAGLLGFVEETLAQLGIQLAADARRGQEELSIAAQSALETAVFQQAHQAGRTLTLATVCDWLSRLVQS